MKLRLSAAAVVLVTTIALSSPASAALTIVSPCDPTLTTPDAATCAGYYSGNLLNGSPADIQNQKEALATLGFNWDGNWSALSSGGNVITSLTGGNQINFGQILSGPTIIGAHFGNVVGPAGNVSVFWLLDLTAPTDHVTLDFPQGFSNAALYSTGAAVPEPATWALMLLGFGGIGAVLRRRRLGPALQSA